MREIVADNLHVCRGHRKVLRGVYLSIRAGECVCLVGPNGAGKTTLMQTLLGLLPISVGTVSLDGEPVGRLSRREVARRIAYVPQAHDGYSGYTVREVVTAGRYPHLEPLGPLQAADHQAVERALAQCELAELADRPLHTLSGGERQKTWIAAALAQDAPALFLDEPTTALDPRYQAELIRLLRSLADQGRTLLVICHDLNVARGLGGRTVALKGGAVAYDGATAEFLSPPRLQEVFETEFEALVRPEHPEGPPWVFPRV